MEQSVFTLLARTDQMDANQQKLQQQHQREFHELLQLQQLWKQQASFVEPELPGNGGIDAGGECACCSRRTGWHTCNAHRRGGV